MGYLNNTSVTIDAILTKKGRELLAMGRDEFNITQFALSDDEIDYDLWNPAHPLGTNYYGAVIENLPMIEALPDESQMMKYKLLTLPKKSSRIPQIDVGRADITVKAGGQQIPITPQTINFEQGNSTLGYTAILDNSDLGDLLVAPGGAVNSGISPSTPRFVGDNESATSISVVGKSFIFVPKDQLLGDLSGTVTIIGNETGGRKVVQVTVKRMQRFTANTALASSARRTFR